MLRNKEKDAVVISLRSARTNAGLTQKEAAKLLGVDPKTIFNREKDSSNLSYELLRKMSSLYQVPIDFFFLGVESQLFETNPAYRLLRKEPEGK